MASPTKRADVAGAVLVALLRGPATWPNLRRIIRPTYANRGLGLALGQALDDLQKLGFVTRAESDPTMTTTYCLTVTGTRHATRLFPRYDSAQQRRARRGHHAR